MWRRSFWIDQAELQWEERPVLWLMGVRRTGKTVLCQSLPGVEYFDCELPRTRALMADPEGFLSGLKGKRVVFDEVHRLENPAEVLKIAADHYRDVKVIATGSSTLGASAKFRDTLAGRKAELWLTPMTLADLEDFQSPDLKHRLLRGGLPPFFLAGDLPERDYQEWIDAYWAKDIQEHFRLERRHSFQKFFELLMARSGGIFEATSYARPCEISRTTVSNYLNALEATFVVHVCRPFSTHRPTEIIAQPKTYAFDTGFVCYYRGWETLRNDDLGPLWEHFVLNELHARLQTRDVRYWRDKQGHEVDFILASRGTEPVVIECKWSSGDLDIGNLKSFRTQYPRGENYVVSHDVARASERRLDGLAVRFVSLEGLVEALRTKMKRRGHR